MNKVIIILSLFFALFLPELRAQGKQLRCERKALDIGVYNYSKVKKCPYKVYYDQEADDKFTEVLMQSERLLNSGIFGHYETFDNDSTVFFSEEDIYEYSPELNYIMKTGGHGYVSAYDLETLERIFVNPSTFVYSPSGKYRVGTYEFDGIKAYLEVKEGDMWIQHCIYEGLRGGMEGIYWENDETIYYLSERQKSDDTKYWIGYSIRFCFEKK